MKSIAKFTWSSLISLWTSDLFSEREKGKRGRPKKVLFTEKLLLQSSLLSQQSALKCSLCCIFQSRHLNEAQWPVDYGVGLRIKQSSVRIRPWPLRWVLGQGSLLPLSQGEAFTLASISYLAILVKYILPKKKKKKKWRYRYICSSMGENFQSFQPMRWDRRSKAMCIFSMFLVTFFFSQNLRGLEEKKQNAQRKKTALAQCSRPPDWQMTHRTHCVERSHSFVIFHQTMTELNSFHAFPVATKVWLFLVLDLSSWAKNVLEYGQPKRSSTLRMHSSCRDRSLDGKLERGLDSRPNTYPDTFVKARPQ